MNDSKLEAAMHGTWRDHVVMPEAMPLSAGSSAPQLPRPVAARHAIDLRPAETGQTPRRSALESGRLWAVLLIATAAACVALALVVIL